MKYVQTVPPHNGQTSGVCYTGFGWGGWCTEMTTDFCLAPNLRMSAAVDALLCIFMHACMGQFYLLLPFIKLHKLCPEQFGLLTTLSEFLYNGHIMMCQCFMAEAGVFSCSPVHVGFVVHQMPLGQFFCKFFGFLLSA